MITVSEVRNRLYRAEDSWPGYREWARRLNPAPYRFPEKRLRAFLEDFGFELEIRALPGYMGLCNNETVMIRKTLKSAFKMATALHEMGHAIMHWRWTAHTLPVWREEIEADTVAYVVSRHLRLDLPDEYYLTYIRAQASEGDVMKALNWGRHRIWDASALLVDALL